MMMSVFLAVAAGSVATIVHDSVMTPVDGMYNLSVLSVCILTEHL